MVKVFFVAGTGSFIGGVAGAGSFIGVVTGVGFFIGTYTISLSCIVILSVLLLVSPVLIAFIGVTSNTNFFPTSASIILYVLPLAVDPDISLSTPLSE